MSIINFEAYPHGEVSYYLLLIIIKSRIQRNKRINLRYSAFENKIIIQI
jgi:hypothetical protein